MLYLQELIDELIDIRDNHEGDGDELPVWLSNNCGEPQPRARFHAFKSYCVYTGRDFVSIQYMNHQSDNINWVPPIPTKGDQDV